MKTIPCCNYCSSPVVWTFAFDGAEYYCLLCGAKTGMMGGAQRIPYTTELRAKQIIINKIWKSLRGDFIGDGGYQSSNCKKCQKNQDRYHHMHLRPLEVAKDDVVRDFLEKLKS